MRHCFKIIFICLFVTLSALFADANIVEVSQVAAAKLPYYINRLPQDMLKEIGVKSVTQLENATLGKPCQLYSITPSTLENYNLTNSVDDILRPTSMWYIPVFHDGKPIAMLIVDKVKDKWKAVSFGYFTLASAWNKVTQQWPDEIFGTKLIVMYQAKTYLFSVSKNAEQSLTPLKFEATSSTKTTGDKISLTSLSDGIIWLKKRIN